jgi:conjugal transfer/type IV secretion protein DotA/TraY
MPLNIGGQNAGLNAAQLITFWTAKTGSNFATNAWGRFNEAITDTYLGQATNLVAEPNYPEVNNLVRFMFVAKTCKIAEELAFGHKPRPGVTYPGNYQPDGVQAYIVRNELGGGQNAIDFLSTDYATALAFSDNGNIQIRFGVQDILENKLDPGFISPLCGTLSIPVTSRNAAATGFSGAYGMQEIYYGMIHDMWMDAMITEGASCVAERIMQVNPSPNCAAWPAQTYTENDITYWTDYLKNLIPAEINRQVTNSEWGVDARLMASGWAGAAIWYNRIAQINGEFSTAISNIPAGDRFPFIMEEIAASNKAKNTNLNPSDVYNPALGGATEIKYPTPEHRLIAGALYKAYSIWEESGAMTTNQTQPTGNIFIDGVNMVFGTHGIYSMRENANIHPLAQLSALGKGMMDSAIRNLAVGFAGGGVSTLLAEYLGGGITGLTKAASSFLFMMGKTTIIMSFILYYVLPFMPFIYFFFAVSGWIKSIFEAIVAMPLWALAHISRLDGNGIPGPGANNGYFLLLDIFLRPILILTGMLASLSIFSACVAVLNDVFHLLASNVSGFDMAAENAGIGPSELAYYRGPIDRFFFSVIYVIICYMMAIGFFKMIDQVPNNILRWMGVSVSTFGEAMGDPAGMLTQKIYAGGTMAMGQITSGGQLAMLLGPGGGPPAQIPQSDPRLKENIVYRGNENGHNVYAFNYIGQTETYIGVMADEVQQTHPEAVAIVNGYMAVHYDRIGVEFRRA